MIFLLETPVRYLVRRFLVDRLAGLAAILERDARRLHLPICPSGESDLLPI